jgi:hypothetical protein
MSALAQSLQKLLRCEREDVALTLQGLFIRIHRIGDIDGDHEFNIHGDRVFSRVRKTGRRR